MTFHYAVTIDWEDTEPADSAIPPTSYQKREQLMADFIGRIITAQMRGANHVAVEPARTPPPGNGRLSQLEPDPAGELERIPERGGAEMVDPAHVSKFAPWQDPGGGELERPYQIDIDARHSVIHQPEEKPLKRATCGNCGVKYEITEDPEENHHRAMRHKLTCGKGDVDQYSGPQRTALLEDFHNQPMQLEFRRRAAAELAAGADPDRLKLTGVSIFGEAPQPARPQIEAAGPELYPGNIDELIAAVTAPRRWWHFWRWFERSAD